MQKELLSTEETRALVNDYVRSFGQRGAARHLTKAGYRSPRGNDIRIGTIQRVLNGVDTCFRAPSPPSKPDSVESALIEPDPVETAATATTAPSAQSQAIHDDVDYLFEEEPNDDTEESATIPESCNFRSGMGPHTKAQVTGIFSFRQPVELEEDKTFFGLPRLKRQPPKITSRPHQPRTYRQVSTREG